MISFLHILGMLPKESSVGIKVLKERVLHRLFLICETTREKIIEPRAFALIVNLETLCVQIFHGYQQFIKEV
jgi:hypothetical protein